MNPVRQSIAWLLLVMLAVVGAGAAVLGASQAPSNVSLNKAIANTVAASSYTELLTESTPVGSQTLNAVYQAPDRLAGYVESGKQRSYIAIIGTTGYRAITVPSTTSTTKLRFYRQTVPPGTAVADAAKPYLDLALHGKNVKTDGATTTMTLSQGGQSATLVYTVSGQYVSELNATAGSTTVHLVLTNVGSSPPVALPAGSRIVGNAPSAGGSASSSGSASSG